MRFSPLLLFLLIIGCTYTQKIKDGRTAYERHQFNEAIPMLEKDFEKEKSRVEKGKIAFLLGSSYEKILDDEEATSWYKLAYDNNYGVEALEAYAYCLKRDQRYTEAARAFKDLGIEIGSPYEYRNEIKACETAAQWLESPSQEVVISPTNFNSNKADYAPALYGDDHLVITSDRLAATGDDPYLWTGNDFSDLFIVDLSNNDVIPFDPALNTENNEGTAAFSADGSEMYFTRCFSGDKWEDNFCKLMYSQRTGNHWTVPIVLPFIEDGVNYGHPTVSADGSTLYFSSNHPDGWGGYDLYVSYKHTSGWSDPQLLSRSINTEKDEQFPFVINDTLYFASDGHLGMGGLDIFKVYKRPDEYWSTAENLKPPFNSGDDDFGFVISNRSNPEDEVWQSGYFTSTRNGGLGGDDIFQFEKITPPEPIEEVVIAPEDYKIYLDIYVLEKIYQETNNPNSKVLGRKPLDGSIVEILEEAKVTSTLDQPEESGAFRMELDQNTVYRFLGSKDGYLSRDADFSTIGIGQDPNNPVQVFELEIELDRIFANREITLENIYYDFDEWIIRDDAKPTLNQLAKDMSLNPNITIQMGSHTDCRGNNRYNEDLSQKRAQSAVDYLIQQGISPERLLAKGFGEDSPEVECACNRCTEDEHQENRRTTFTILDE